MSIFEQFTVLIDNSPDLSITWLNNGTLTVSDSTRYVFDANHRCLSNEFFDVAFNGHSKTVYTYGANNLIASMIDSNYTGGTLTDVTRTLMSYTPQNRLQSLQQDPLNLANSQWGATMLDSMFYDAGNRLARMNMYAYNTVSSQWDAMYSYRYTYNAANKVVVDTAAFWNSNAWVDAGIEDHLYDASNRRVSITRRSFSGTGWDFQDRDSMQYAGANPYPQAVLSQNYTMSWDWTQKNTYSYNAGYQVTVDSAFSYDQFAATWNPSDMNWYYYENYNPSSVGTQPELNAEVALYPVPAQEYLQVSFHREGRTPLTWQLRSADGRVLQQGETGNQASGLLRINLHGMPAGLYLFTLQGSEGSMVRRFVKE